MLATSVSDALVVPPTCFFWQSAPKPLDVRIYGEFANETIGANAAGESVDWVDAGEVSSRRAYQLCRCGHSSTKPLCDGTHALPLAA